MITPASSAAIAVIGLNVEPVGYAPLTARSVSGPLAVPLPSSSCVFALVSGFANLFGSKLGEEPIASTSPVARVERDERSGDRRFAAGARVFDALLQRFFALFLQAQVERHLQAVPGLAAASAASLLGTVVSGRVDADPLNPGSPRR